MQFGSQAVAPCQAFHTPAALSIHNARYPFFAKHFLPLTGRQTLYLAVTRHAACSLIDACPCFAPLIWHGHASILIPASSLQWMALVMGGSKIGILRGCSGRPLHLSPLYLLRLSFAIQQRIPKPLRECIPIRHVLSVWACVCVCVCVCLDGPADLKLRTQWRTFRCKC